MLGNNRTPPYLTIFEKFLHPSFPEFLLKPYLNHLALSCLMILHFIMNSYIIFLQHFHIFIRGPLVIHQNKKQHSQDSISKPFQRPLSNLRKGRLSHPRCQFFSFPRRKFLFQPLFCFLRCFSNPCSGMDIIKYHCIHMFLNIVFCLYLFIYFVQSLSIKC